MDISRSGWYYQPKGISDEDLVLMKLIDRQYLVTPFYGARKMAAWLKSQCHREPEAHPAPDATGWGSRPYTDAPEPACRRRAIRFTRTC